MIISLCVGLHLAEALLVSLPTPLPVIIILMVETTRITRFARDAPGSLSGCLSNPLGIISPLLVILVLAC